MTSKQKKLAIEGGVPVRRKPFPKWPVWDDSDAEAVADVVRSGLWSRHEGSTAVAEFESEFAAYQGCSDGIATGNGAQAMRLALLGMGLPPGTEVVVPSFTFISTATTVVECNMVPVFADIDPDTFNISRATVEPVLSSRTGAIIPVHYAGQACEMDDLMALANERGLLVLEDTAHAHGAAYQGRMLGSVGHAAAWSFQAVKNLTAGEGGMLTTNDAKLAGLCRSIGNYGRESKGWYGHVRYGANFRMGELQGALLRTQLQKLPAQLLTRIENAAYLDQQLAHLDGIVPLTVRPSTTTHGRSMYVFKFLLQASTGTSREEFTDMLNAEGVPCTSVYPAPVYEQPVFAHQDFGPHRLELFTDTVPDYRQLSHPGCLHACATGVSLPQRVLLATRSDLDDVVRAIEKIVSAL